MRTKLVAGNWKMNLDRAGAASLALAVREGAANCPRVELAVFPPAVYLQAVANLLVVSPVGWGAQNVYFENNGAFTGETSAAMLADLGCRYVIIGHSERRHILGETDADVGRKVRAALAAGLTPIACVGETLAERQQNRTAQVIARHFEGIFSALSADAAARVVIAYEPVWAIGTGQVATPQQAQEVHADLRKHLNSQYNAAVAEEVRILYGGSVKPANAGELLAQRDIDGALVGGASLIADDFLAIAANA